MIYGHNGTIHGTQYLDIEVRNGEVVAVWFRCCMLPFKQCDASSSRAKDMREASKEVNARCKLNAVDIDTGERDERQ